MSTEAEAGLEGLQYWIPELARALDDDRAGAGQKLRDAIAERTARIGLDDDVIVVSGSTSGEITVVADASDLDVDGEGFTTSRVVKALLDGRVTMNQVIISGGVNLRSSIDDALWMYYVIELLLDGASRVTRLRDLADRFRETADEATDGELLDWRTGTVEREVATLDRLGLLENQREDRDG